MKNKIKKVLSSFLCLVITFSSFTSLINITTVNAGAGETQTESKYLKFNKTEKEIALRKNFKIYSK